MKNKLTDLNNHLFAALERLNDEDVDGEKLQEEIERSKAITGVAREIISNAQTVTAAAKTAHDMGLRVTPSFLGLEDQSK